MDGKISWLEPVQLDFERALANEAKLLKELQRQLADGVASHGTLTRCVYVIRMTGPFIIAYPKNNSPVLYVGSGQAGSRLASHLRNWLSEVHKFGRDVGIEIRICMPRRRKLLNFFKHVEADLIERFLKKYGSLPFFNSRREPNYAAKVEYNKTINMLLDRAIGIGNGNRPRWAIKPTPANKNLALYLKGTSPH
jgi:hypothetical protein